MLTSVSRDLPPTVPDPPQPRPWYMRPYARFEQGTTQRFPVGPEDRQQRAALLLIRKQGMCAYRGVEGLFCEVGVPKNPQNAGRTYKANKVKRTPPQA